MMNFVPKRKEKGGAYSNSPLENQESWESLPDAWERFERAVDAATSYKAPSNEAARDVLRRSLRRKVAAS
jgi:hypothetical protein